LPALKAFLEGEQLCREGYFLEAVEAYQRAVEADSTFALAWIMLWSAVDMSPKASSSGVDQDYAIAQARRYADTLPTRERTLFEASELGSVWTGRAKSEDAARAEDLFRSVLAHHPYDATAWRGLGMLLHFWSPFWGRPMEDAMEALERSVELVPEGNYASGHLVSVYAKLDLADKADSLFQRGLDEASPDGDFSLIDRITLAFSRPDSAAQARIIPEIRERDGFLTWELNNWNALPLARGLISEKVLRIRTEPDRDVEVRAYGHLYIALVRAARGMTRGAQTEIVSASEFSRGYSQLIQAMLSLTPLWQVSRSEHERLFASLEDLPEEDFRCERFSEDEHGYAQMKRVFVMGLLAVRLGDLETASELMDRLEQRTPDWEGTSVWTPLELESQTFTRMVRAEVLAARGNPSGALAEIEQCTPYLHRAWTRMFGDLALARLRYLRAELLTQLGRPGEALRWYNSIGMSSLSAHHEVVYLAPAYFRKAEVYEQLGRNEEAIHDYSEFIDFWRDCDPELQPWVDTVRERVLQLGSQSVAQ
jgi:tetratricopeptide (TPR) repeat protein